MLLANPGQGCTRKGRVEGTHCCLPQRSNFTRILQPTIPAKQRAQLQLRSARPLREAGQLERWQEGLGRGDESFWLSCPMSLDLVCILNFGIVPEDSKLQKLFGGRTPCLAGFQMFFQNFCCSSETWDLHVRPLAKNAMAIQGIKSWSTC